tara:strand:- start:145 stop:345 length:201 start_codon:yes stop_codon:yes gene_type:complete
MWELWQWDGRYIKGKKIKRSKTKETVVKHAKKTIKYKKMVKGSKKNEFFLEDEEGRSVGMIINKEK